jgi:hypothetical protein
MRNPSSRPQASHSAAQIPIRLNSGGYNGVPPALAAEAMRRGGRGESSVVYDTPFPLAAWPDVPTRVILCQEDHFLPAPFMRRVAQERLGITPDEVPGCHCVALSHPRELSDLLVSYLD